MSQHKKARWLLTYDIADPRRLGRMFRFLKKQGVPVQYSVFLLEVSAHEMNQLLPQMAKIIHPQADDVRAYCLPANLWQATLGKAILPEGSLPTQEFLK